ncbi:MAG: hypothetical protein A2020_10520 [Lentisphaerae bacterium GWF2_45_14]|nr:MAG: hypothetical protein A2020_10520 [Lentisphaerae bacterium GWF2_45_14]
MEETRLLKSELCAPLNILVLIGLICQGMVWDNYLMPCLFAGAWLLCLIFRDTVKIPHVLELICFSAALFLCVKYGGRHVYEKSVSIGNALAVLQIFFLLRKPSPREKLISAASAIIQTAIGSQVIIGYGFIAVLAASALLLPKVFSELEESSFQTREKRKFKISAWSVTVIVLTSLVFFAAFPRIRVTGGIGSIGSAGAMQPELETSRSIMESGNQTIFQIEGSDITYLKSYALDTFDGNTWTAGKMSYVKKRSFTKPGPDSLHRKAAVRDLKLMGTALPTDAYVRMLQGNFFPGAYISDQGNVIATMVWNTSENIYEYWTDKLPPQEPLTKRELNSFLKLPPNDPEISRFLAEIIGSEKEAVKQAKKLESHLRNNFKYVTGAPNLQKNAPLRDFLLVKKEGHCERFASALAVLLRMKNIPSRVAVGFYPIHKNEIGDFYNVGSSDAHAWTEAYLPGRGWTILDATPYAERNLRKSRTLVEAARDWFEFFWYTKIVNFSVSEQRGILDFIKSGILVDVKKLIIHMLTLTGIVLSIFLMYRKRKYLKKFFASARGKKRGRILEIRNFYGEMLSELSRLNLFKGPGETPYEFLTRIEGIMPEIAENARVITESFCEVKYAEHEPNTERMRKIRESAETLKTKKRRTPFL